MRETKQQSRYSLGGRLLFLAAACAACGGQEAGPTPVRKLDRPAVYERAERTFATGVLLRPASDADDPLAPLLILETPSDGPEGRLQPETVYVHEGAVELAGHLLRQRSYGWSYADGSTRGLRMTLGSDGFPALFEVLGDPSGIRPIFVTDLVDADAAAEHGAPHPNRRFAVERSVPEAPDVVVPGLLEPGPEPLGPFVYVAQGSQEITTLICRCMPSRIDEVLDSVEYALVPWSPDSNAPPAPPWLRDSDSRPLERLLRLPAAGI